MTERRLTKKLFEAEGLGINECITTLKLDCDRASDSETKTLRGWCGGDVISVMLSNDEINDFPRIITEPTNGVNSE